jgi:hypothetical protein
MVTEDFIDKGGTSHRGYSVTKFVAVALATHDYYDNIAHSVKQTYKAVRKLGSTSSIAATPPTIPTIPNNPT